MPQSYEANTSAKYWRCALQVNPVGYQSEYRGQDHGMTEEQYNLELLSACQEMDIKVLGIADHGNVSRVDTLRDFFTANNIVVFPGFEISTTEKAHFVCLFPENTTTEELNRYLGTLGLTDPQDGVRPSSMGAADLLEKVNDLGGFCYAAHVIDNSGILQRKLNHVWIHSHLWAAQIPATVDDLKTDEWHGFRQILLNKNPDYERTRPLGIINAKDVAEPSDLRNTRASCLIKMTKPCFASFKQAFLDPHSRVRLNSDVSDQFHSRIERLRFIGGYLDGVDIRFSDHLNAIIGGRGAGKSTLLECVRYVLGREPIGKNARKQHSEIIGENLGKEKGRVELTVRSSAMHGNRYVLSRRYGESTIVRDSSENVSTLSPHELLPRIELFSQNEIYEIIHDVNGLGALLKRFLFVENANIEKELEKTRDALGANREKVERLDAAISIKASDVEELPKLEEKAKQFAEMGLEEKLKSVPQLEQERTLSEKASQAAALVTESVEELLESKPNTTFLDDAVLKDLPHAESLKTIRGHLERIAAALGESVEQFKAKFAAIVVEMDAERESLEKAVGSAETSLVDAFAEIPDCEGRSGKEIGAEYQELLKGIQRIKPLRKEVNELTATLRETQEERVALLAKLSELRADRSATLQRALKKLNRQVKDKLRITVCPEANRQPLLACLKTCNMEGVGDKRLSWIESAEDFSPIKLAQKIRVGADALRSCDWGIVPSVAEALGRLTKAKVMDIEEIELPDTITIELNVAQDGSETYRALERLSTGQQCTAVLHLLLLDNSDPLIIDQPEDNLDNAFIADRIVTELRSAKIQRQFIFATHNANIPVFGDAEWIGVLNTEDGQAVMPPDAQGAIDLPTIQKMAADILEGGRAAFIQRKDKYGF